jgi:hypothetical protein
MHMYPTYLFIADQIFPRAFPEEEAAIAKLSKRILIRGEWYVLSFCVKSFLMVTILQAGRV